MNTCFSRSGSMLYVLEVWSPLLGPRRHLKSLGSKPTSLQKCSVLDLRTVLFPNWLKRKIVKQKTAWTSGL